ncbi:hypothetical protein Tco_0819171 [Tanacetum coccineum]|uniref:Uncharacterized protein n=1 Tax=Tanacetum coccineum TaxID=301880 RepID=A0ABQ5A8W1_9ASTR
MESPLTSQRLNALTVRSWVTLLGNASLLNIRQTEQMEEFDDDPVTFAMVALNGIEEDDWSIEIDADHVDLGQDGLGVFDWSEEADNAPVALALMATSSTDSSNSEGYQLSLESLEVIIRTHEKNEYAWGDKYEQMEYDLKMRDWKLGEKQKEFDNVIKERDELKEKLEKWSKISLDNTRHPNGLIKLKVGVLPRKSS